MPVDRDTVAGKRPYYSQKEHERWENSMVQFWDVPDQEPIVCKTFGCGVHLSLFEALAGHYCQRHSIQEPRPDPTKFVSY